MMLQQQKKPKPQKMFPQVQILTLKMLYGPWEKCHLPLSIIFRPFPPALFLAMLDIASEKKLSLQYFLKKQKETT